jgi:hypothetical protein
MREVLGLGLRHRRRLRRRLGFRLRLGRDIGRGLRGHRRLERLGESGCCRLEALALRPAALALCAIALTVLRAALIA